MPKHIAVIMDGNGRWAKKRFLPRIAGHKKGIDNFRMVVEACVEKQIQALTFFAFSTENWNRPFDEVNGLMSLFISVITKEIKNIHKNNIRLQFIGDKNKVNLELQNLIKDSEALTQNNTGLRLNIAFSYGGRWDIVNACKKIVKKASENQITEDAITEELFEQHLELAEVPNCDLLIRSGGECRISNFLIWKLAYAEIYFTDILWPGFKKTDFEKALDFFATRERRYGRTSEQVKEKEVVV